MGSPNISHEQKTHLKTLTAALTAFNLDNLRALIQNQRIKNSLKKVEQDMNLKNRLEDYTESEYADLINRLFQGGFSSEKEHDTIVEIIVSTSEHPNGTGVLYDPAEGTEDSPEGVLKAIKIWRAANGRPSFKSEV